MNSPHTHDQAPADGGNAQRKRPAEGPAEDNPADDNDQVKTNTATQSSAENFPTTTSHPHTITTPEPSVTSSRHEQRSHNGSDSDPRKVGSLQKIASFDAQQQTLQGLRKTDPASADRGDRPKCTVDSPGKGVQENPKGVVQTATDCGTIEDLTDSPPPTLPSQAEVDSVIIFHQPKTADEERIAFTRGDIGKDYGALVKGIAEIRDKPQGIGGNSKYGDFHIYASEEEVTAFFSRFKIFLATNASGQQAQLEVSVLRSGPKTNDKLSRASVAQLTVHVIVKLAPGWQFRRVMRHHLVEAFKNAGFISFKSLRETVKIGAASTNIKTDTFHLNVRPLNGSFDHAAWPSVLAIFVSKTGHAPPEPAFLEYAIASDEKVDGRICLRNCHKFKRAHGIYIDAPAQFICMCDDANPRATAARGKRVTYDEVGPFTNPPHFNYEGPASHTIPYTDSPFFLKVIREAVNAAPQPCSFFESGRCRGVFKTGIMCAKAHSAKPPGDIVCKVGVKKGSSFCKNGEHCAYAHQSPMPAVPADQDMAGGVPPAPLCSHPFCDRWHCRPSRRCHAPNCHRRAHHACVCTDQLCTAAFCSVDHYIFCSQSGRKLGPTCFPFCGGKITDTCPNWLTARDCGAWDCHTHPRHGFECTCTVVHPGSGPKTPLQKSNARFERPPGADLLEFDVYVDLCDSDEDNPLGFKEYLKLKDLPSPAPFHEPGAKKGDDNLQAGCSTDPQPGEAPS